MPSATETMPSDLAAPLFEGLEQISRNQTITFTKYVREVFPADQFVYWVKGSLVVTPPERLTLTVNASLHRTVGQSQVEDATYGVNRIILTSETEVDEFNTIEPQEMWLGSYDGVRFSFNSLSMRYTQAGLFHYMGDAVYPFMESQIIDTVEQLDALGVVVSNSLPLWLTLTMGGAIPVYPSFLVPENIRPPYVAVHIAPEGTQAIQAAPYLGPRMQHYQLVQDRVRVTTYGLNNTQVLDWLDYVLAYSVSSDALGIMNMPVPRDEKRIQSELSVIAQKKTIEFDVNYYQSVVRDIARKYILSAVVSYTIGGGVVTDLLADQDGAILETQDDEMIGVGNG